MSNKGKNNLYHEAGFHLKISHPVRHERKEEEERGEERFYVVDYFVVEGASVTNFCDIDPSIRPAVICIDEPFRARRGGSRATEDPLEQFPKDNSGSSVNWSAVPNAPLESNHVVNCSDGAAIPKGSITYSTTQLYRGGLSLI